MNFLSHYYFDKNSTKPERVLGLILPDLIHQHNKTWVFKPEKNLALYSGKTLDLLEGWKRHKAIDKYFHNSPYFKSQTQIIKEKLHTAFLKSPVWAFFLAHITLELTLDSLLITENLIDVEAFYSKLDQVDRDSLVEFLNINEVSEPESFLDFYTEFLNSGYLFKYRNPAELTYPLGRICFKIWKEKFTEEEVFSLRETILDFCKENRSKFLEIYEYIEIQLKNDLNCMVKSA